MSNALSKHTKAPVGPKVMAQVGAQCRAVLAAILCAWSMIILAGPLAADTPQQGWVGDLPIMQGMEIEPQLGFAFDSPEGRIVQVFATGPSEHAPVISYYNAALAGLGWAGADGRWQRDGEVLVISQVEMASGRLWRIRLSPL